MVEVIGWAAGILFAICSIPQAYKSWKDGKTTGVSPLFLWLWLGGEILSQIYVLLKHGWDMPLLVNYWVNTLFIIIIMKYLYYPKK